MTAPQHLLQAFFAKATASFHKACAPDVPCQDLSFALAGQRIRLRIAGAEMAAQIAPAFEQLAAQEALSPALTVYAWDARRSDGLLPPPPWERTGYFERGNLRGYSDERFSLVYDHSSDVFSAVDCLENVGHYWTRDASRLPQHELSAPLRHIFQRWFQPQGIFVVHAAAVGRPEGGLLLAGRGGSGKSTTALLCLQAGLRFAGDDFVLASATPRPYAFSLYNSAKANGATVIWEGGSQATLPDPPRVPAGKVLAYMNRVYPDRMAEGFPLRAVVLPRRTPQTDTQFERIASDVAYRTIVPDTVLRTLAEAPFVFRAFRELLARVDCYQMALGTDLAQIPRAILRILDNR